MEIMDFFVVIFIVVGLYFVIPLFIISLFSILTYRQMSKLTYYHRHSLSQLTKQMTRMVLFEILT